jgi:hypothetical protein
MRVRREGHAIFCCIECGHRDHADVRAANTILRCGNTTHLPVERSRRRLLEAGTPEARHISWNSAAFTAGRYVKTNVLRAATHWPSMLCNSRCAVGPPRLQTSHQWIAVAEEKRYFPKEPEKHVVWPILLTLLRSRTAVVSRRGRVAFCTRQWGYFESVGGG